MTPATITNLDPIQVTWYKLPKPIFNHFYFLSDYKRGVRKYERGRTIADVENVNKIKGSPVYSIRDIGSIEIMFPIELELNQQVFIELTGEGKCKIVKI